jgi:peptidoglycan/xylan/chitin deacetylase (PgdA/CDA1 family)
LSRGTWAAAALLVVALLGYGAWRVYEHGAHLLEPAILTPRMNAGPMLHPTVRARITRVLHPEDDRRDRPKLIALTFDDGPYPVTTPLLLDELRDLHVPGTFFLIGRDAQQWPELAQRIEADGDEIADHTLTHPDLDRETPEQVRAEILGGRDALWAIAPDPGIRKYFRPPHGRFTLQTIQVAQSLGYDVVLWNDDAGDWRTLTPAALARHLERHATAPEIVLLHSGKQATIDMLPEVVARFRAAGYTFVTVGTLLGRVSPEWLNHPAKHGV